MMDRLLWIALAGALGTATRYLIGLWSADRLGTLLPYGTLIVNFSGCFLIALVLRVALQLPAFPPTLRLALTTGFMGGLTTYSSFNYESTELLLGGKVALAWVNIATTLLVCFLAGLLGTWLGNRLVSP
jgi:CrcB protein